MSTIKVALVNPPLAGHKFRGTGTYGEELFKALKKIDDIDISQVDYTSDLSSFNVVHYPYFDPFFLTLPIVKTKPTIVTVHDLIPFKFPKYFERGIRGEIKWFIQKLSLSGAKAVVTDSIASQNDIAQFTGIGEEKINVIYLGVRSEFKVVNSNDILKEIIEKYKLPEKFLLHVGDVNYNKNIPGIINAFAKVSKKYGDLNLILVGNGFVENSSQLQELMDLVSRLGVEDKVKRLGFIELSDLVGVYNLAQVYLQLSYAEGFGLPVLEAMASGCSVIAANTSSLPELTVDAAILVDPNSEKDITQNIETLLTHKIKRQEIIDAGLQRVKEFTWDKCAKQTFEVYKSII